MKENSENIVEVSKSESKDVSDSKELDTPEHKSPVPERKSLSDLVKESNNSEAVSIKNQIDELRKQRDVLINEIKDYRRKLEYKQAENVAILKFIDVEKDNVDLKKIGYLRKQKNRLEFKLSTEARMTLNDEKDIIRKIGELDGQLAGLLKFAKLERKIGYIKDDINSYTEKLNETDKKIRELDVKLDDLYRSLRRSLGIRAQNTEAHRPVKRRQQQPPQQEINLEDIAVIKKKASKKEEE